MSCSHQPIESPREPTETAFSGCGCSNTELHGYEWVGWVVLILAVHVVGRVAVFCVPDHVDSMTYSLAAYRFWQPTASAADLIPDKPPGQALLTGWCFRVWPGPPSRLVLVPIESAFMLAAYLVFFCLCRRLFGRRSALLLTLMFALGHNVYSVVDTTTDGFNLNENYLLLPLALAVTAHLGSHAAWRRGLLRGVAIGVALTIKQTAVGLLVALLVDDLWRWRTGGGRRVAGLWVATGIGTAMGIAPVVLVLATRGWLVQQLHDMSQTTGMHLMTLVFRWPAFLKLTPLLPMAWWVVAGVAARDRSSKADVGMPLVFAVVWLLTEAWIVWTLTIPAAHYYQQLLAPACLLAGIGMCAVKRGIRAWPMRMRVAAWRSLLAATMVLMLYETMPMGRLARLRIQRFSVAGEARSFQEADESGLLNQVVNEIRGKAYANHR